MYCKTSCRSETLRSKHGKQFIRYHADRGAHVNSYSPSQHCNALQPSSREVADVGDSGRGGYEIAPSSLIDQSHSYGGGREGEHAADRDSLRFSFGEWRLLRTFFPK